MSSGSPPMESSSTNAALPTQHDQKHFDDAAEKKRCSSPSLGHLQRNLADPSDGRSRGINYTFGLDALHAYKKNQPSSLERLPTELRVMILEYMGDYASLWALISASPYYLKAFLGVRNPLLTKTTIRELETRSVYLCAPPVSNRMREPEVALNAQNIEGLDYKVKRDVEITLTLQANLYSALQTYYSQIESNTSPCLDVQQLKALRTLDDVVMWLDFDPELQKHCPHGSKCEAMQGASRWCVLMRESTIKSYDDINNLEVPHSYHTWSKGRLTESEIRPARIALVWFLRKAKIVRQRLDKVETFQRYFPWCNVRTRHQLISFENEIKKSIPTVSFLFASGEITVKLCRKRKK
ncbi:MAG: hypothetical protein HETSPECPRED_007357 [Heterodermia speciosa]|uniref:Uncharacterized protein n=1 Tax=Heterodermia speciosa TaxID=116794 RepID=A0A8H3FR92_9LECA|nr:MAG: hypothetical protein HETSPECPRED_007357 [Heterodermia speciosa]